MEKINVLGIAPYDELNHSMQVIAAQYPEINASIFTADLEDGQLLAEKMQSEGFDAIISRGGTARLIRQSVSLPVIDVSLSIYDVLSAIRLAENYTENFAIVGYPSITEKAHLLCDLLGYSIEIQTIYDKQDAQTILDTIAEKGYPLILCDAITNRIAQSRAFNTLLITSGLESIKSAFNDAVTIVTQVNQVKREKAILAQGILAQSPYMILFDQAFRTVFTSITDERLQDDIRQSLRTNQTKTGESQLYVAHLDRFFSLNIASYTLDDAIFYSCWLQKQQTPAMRKEAAVTYQKKNDVEDQLAKQLLATQLIPSTIKDELTHYKNSFRAYLVFGESGTAKNKIAKKIYLEQTKNNNYLITIDCKTATDKLWKFLVNAANGPFVDMHNTIFFSNIDQLDLTAIERLLDLIKSTNVLRRNQIIFTYDTNHSDNPHKFDRLVSELHSAKIYAPAVRERKNELNILTTLLLNKVNIAYSKEIMGFEPNALNAFLDYDWPGNFDQLEDCVKELVVNATTHYISDHQVTELLNKERLIHNFASMKILNVKTKNSLHQPTLFDYTKEIILHVLEQNKGNQSKTAAQLGISRTTLWRYLKEDA